MDQYGFPYYECSICLTTAKDSVVTICGHLFCWPCLHQWFLTWPRRKRCPLCRRRLNENLVVRLDPRNNNRNPVLGPFFSWIWTAIRIIYAIRYLFIPIGLFIYFAHNLEDPRPQSHSNDDIVEGWKLFLYMVIPTIGCLLFG